MNYKMILKNLIWNVIDKRSFIREFDIKYNNLLKLSENPGSKDYYVIRRQTKVGLFSYVETTLRQIAYAMDNNMVPLVYMLNVENSYVDDDKVSDVNMWDLFFEQPVHSDKISEVIDFIRSKECEGQKYSDGDIAVMPDGSRIIFSVDDNMSKIPYRGSYLNYEKSKWYWGKMYECFLRLNKDSKEYCDSEAQELLGGNAADVLGVLVRGTDFNYAVGHNIQPQPEAILEIVKGLIDSGKYSKIYLATEEYANELYFKKELGDDIVLVNKRVYFDAFDFADGKTINDVIFDRDNDKYLRGIEYLSSVELLSKCGGIVAGLCGGTVAASYINNSKYRDRIYIDLGIRG